MIDGLLAVIERWRSGLRQWRHAHIVIVYDIVEEA